jgi:hypothetical protein
MRGSELLTQLFGLEAIAMSIAPMGRSAIRCLGDATRTVRTLVTPAKP